MSKTKQEQEAQPLKMKKPSFTRENDETFKLDLSKKEEPKTEVNAVQKQETKEPVLPPAEKEEKQVVELQEVGSTHAKEKPEITEITNTKTPPVQSPPIEMPKGIEKLVSFMQETGGTVQDYARLNVDLDKLDGDTLLRQYYKSTKPHLDHEEIDFLLHDKYDTQDEDDERSAKKKKLALKEEIASARSHFENTKKKYYEELKLRSNNVQDDEAREFFNRYNKEQEIANKQQGEFASKTENFFNNEFKGFEITVGDKKFNYNVKNPSNIAQQQSKTNTIFKKFLGKQGEISDLQGYHKAAYAANNIDTIAEHYYTY